MAPCLQSVSAWLLCAMFCAPIASAQNTANIEATSITVDSNITSVTLYRGRASITRAASRTLDRGLYELRFSGLPETIQPATLQARASGSTKVLSVDFAQEAAPAQPSAKLADLDAKIEELQRSLKETAEQRELIKSQEALLDSIAARISKDAGDRTGTDKLDLDALGKQLVFVAKQRSDLLTERRELDAKQKDLEKQLQVAQANRQSVAGTGAVNRTAVVTVAAVDPGPSTIELTYLVANATWEPTYNIRASVDGSSALVEYDAILTQRTGEDWDDVQLVLSTALPAVAANPPTLTSWFVDVARRETARDSGGGFASGGEVAAEYRAKAPGAPPAPMRAEMDDDRERLRELSANAQVEGGGPSVTFQLPRAVTVKTNSQRQQRTRVATIDTHPKFIYVAIPQLTPSVYLRGELTNTSAFQLLPGRASIFMGQDFIGPTGIDAVAPGSEFKVHFGIDQSVKTSRNMVAKKTENTGLLSGGRRTSYEYRLGIDNGSGKAITVELWDRYPVSRNEAIQVELADLSFPVSTDAYYTAEEKPQGLLKWIIDVPASARDANAHIISYGVHVNRGKEVEMTPLPE